MYDDILGKPDPKTFKKANKKITNADLRQLNGDEILALQEGDDGDYWVKLTRLYDPLPKVEWRGKCKLHIQRSVKDELAVLTPKPDTIPIPWAEYCHLDINDDGSCVCEDYLMEIWVKRK